MKTVTDLKEWLWIRKQYSHKSLGFVHTMGFCHAGHLSLCAQSQAENDITVVAIFVNPTQFDQLEDFTSYPRNIKRDAALFAKQNIDYLLLFDEKTIYPDHCKFHIEEVGDLSKKFEAKFRPGYIKGMLTVVLKYLNIVKPTRSYYGEKDYQQLLLIKNMVQAFFLEVEIIGCSTLRDIDGLALSSRNVRLSPQERKIASYFPQILNAADTAEIAEQQLRELGFRVDYVADFGGKRLAAVYVGKNRLIDAVSLK